MSHRNMGKSKFVALDGTGKVQWGDPYEYNTLEDILSEMEGWIDSKRYVYRLVAVVEPPTSGNRVTRV